MKKWQENIRKVVPYTPGEQPNIPGMIKLNTNENPYPPAPGVRRALEEMKEESFRLYPDPACSILVEALSERYQRPKEQFFVGVGSDDVLAMAFLTFFNSEKPVLFPDITYSFYPVWAKLFGITYECPTLDEEFRIVKEDYVRENGGVIFPNPNAPTGIYIELGEVEEIICKNPDVIVIVDEAYVDFAGPSAMELVDQYDNLLVVQTFSKSRSMAGMRIGFAVGNPLLIKYLNDVKYSFNSYTMSRAALELGVAAVKDEAYFQENLKRLTTTRERTKRELKALGFHFPDSGANFIFASHKSCPAKEIFESLRERNIYVRYFDAPRLQKYLRITIGTDEEMDTLLKALREITV